MAAALAAFRRILFVAPWLLMLGLAASLALHLPWARMRDLPTVALTAAMLLILFGAAGVVIARIMDARGVALFAWLEHARPGRVILIATGLAGMAGGVYLLMVPAWPLISDPLAYQDLARGLVSAGTYSVQVTDDIVHKAFRPPGYPFALVPLAAVNALSVWAVLAQNVLFLGLGAVFTYVLGRDLFGRGVGLAGAMVLCASPGLVLGLGLSMPGPLSMMLMAGAAWGWVRLLDDPRWWRWALLAGGFTGALALVKPAFILWPTAWVLMLFMRRGSVWRDARRFITCCLVAAAVVAPWTIRNAVVLDAFVPVSTNGGWVFYRANNPLATGTYTPHGERDLLALASDEVLWNRVGMQWGIEFIRENPLKFLELVLHKQRFLLAEDDFAAWFTYGRWLEAPPEDGAARDATVAAVLQNISTAWWVGVWLLVAVGLVRHRSAWVSDPCKAALLWSVLFLVVVHSVFESQSRYHAPLLGVLAMAAAAAGRPRQVLGRVPHQSLTRSVTPAE